MQEIIPEDANHPNFKKIIDYKIFIPYDEDLKKQEDEILTIR